MAILNSVAWGFSSKRSSIRHHHWVTRLALQRPDSSRGSTRIQKLRTLTKRNRFNWLQQNKNMRLQVFSDLHLEFGRFEPALKNPDVVVLAGDIHQGTAGVKWAGQYCRDCPVIYVPGNHEFYNHSIPDLIQALKREARGGNVHVLENNAVIINDFVFLGCSLWTNFHLWPDARAAMDFADQEMSDFWLIQKP